MKASLTHERVNVTATDPDSAVELKVKVSVEGNQIDMTRETARNLAKLLLMALNITTAKSAAQASLLERVSP